MVHINVPLLYVLDIFAFERGDTLQFCNYAVLTFKYSIVIFKYAVLTFKYFIMQFWHSNISLRSFDIQIFHYAVLTFKYFITQFWHSNISLCSFENQSSVALLKYAYMITVGTGNWVVIFIYPFTAFETEFDVRIFIFNLEMYLFIRHDTQWPVFGVKPSRDMADGGETPFDRQRAVSLLQEATHFLQQYSSHPISSTNQSVRGDSQHLTSTSSVSSQIARPPASQNRDSGHSGEECYRISKPFLRPIRKDRVLPQIQVFR